jgi:hypothetical protein
VANASFRIFKYTKDTVLLLHVEKRQSHKQKKSIYGLNDSNTKKAIATTQFSWSPFSSVSKNKMAM